MKKLNHLTQKQGEYLQEILDWAYNNHPQAVDKFIIASTDNKRIWEGVDMYPSVEYQTYTYEVSMIKYIIEGVLLERGYPDTHREYLNKLKPLYKHIKNLTSDERDTKFD